MSPSILALGPVLALAAGVAAPAAPNDWIPFELFRDGYLYLHVRVEGIETEAVLDSGAAVTCVSASFARELGLRNGRKGAARGVGGMVSLELFEGVDFEVGAVRFEDVRVAAIDFTEVEEGLGRPLPVVLGRAFFEDHVLDVDYPRRRLAFREWEGFRYEGEGGELVLHDTSRGLWEVDVRLDGKATRFVLDTGRGNALGIEADFAERNGLLEGRARVSTTLTGGAGGRWPAKLTTVGSLTLGGHVLAALPAVVLRSDEPGMAMNRTAGAIGTPVLSRFRAIFDARRRRLILEPDAELIAAPFPKDRFGLQTVREEGRLRVVHVATGSPAAAAGWNVGDLVHAIEGKRIGADYWEVLGGWNQREPGTRVVLEDGDGVARELVAAEYF